MQPFRGMRSFTPRRDSDRLLTRNAARAVHPLVDLHAAAGVDQGQAHLMTAFEGAVDATFAAFGIDAAYTPRRG